MTHDAARHLALHGLYDPANEHDACGVGLIAETQSPPSRRVVDAAIEALKNVWHRGAVDADGKTGDGAGIMVDLPVGFFLRHIARTAHRPDGRLLGVGQVFLPRTNLADQEACRTIVESEIIDFGYRVYGWRQVPVDIGVIGAKAMRSRPEIEQIMIAGPDGADKQDEFEKNLYLIRRRIEKRVVAAQIPAFYICSLSSRSIVYKGLFLAESLSIFYPDLMDAEFVSRFAIYHQRYSTNTFPQWWLAQPFRCLAHNGEINTVRGNKNWMASHEIRMASIAFGEHGEDIKPVIPAGASDTAALDAVFEAVVRAGTDAPTAKLILVPEAWGQDTTLSPDVRAMYAYFASVMEPWDGPAALAMTDGRWALVGLDRNALRPMRYLLTRDGLFVSGSEAGMVSIAEGEIVRKGRLGPGEMAAIDLRDGGFHADGPLKARIAAAEPYADWVGEFATLADLGAGAEPPVRFPVAELKRRQVAAGRTMEDMELILAPMVADAKEAIGSMGDDTPLAVISEFARDMSHFFRQNFAQVTNPPIDPLREGRVMSLKTRFGNFANILDRDVGRRRVLVLDSPVITNREWTLLRDHFGARVAEIDCTFAGEGGADALRAAIARIRAEAERHVREGRTELFLTDEHIGPDKVAVQMILAAAAVHSHLVRCGLRTFASVNVRAAQCLDTHHFAVLVGVGATTVNAYLAQESIADRHARGLCGALSLDEAVARYRKAIDDGLLKIIAKMGIAVISSYRGGYNFEAVGLSRAILNDLMPGLPGRLSGEGYTSLHLNAMMRHEAAFDEPVVSLPMGGFYRQRAGGEAHAYEAAQIHLLQSAVASGSYKAFLTYSERQAALPPSALRDLFDFVPTPAIDVGEVESVSAIRRRFVTPGMSLGALSPEAHATLAVAMNRIGARAVSGEGGEDAARFKPDGAGDNANSAIKQIASGRFGVTAEYLNACEEIEIKVAQGAKPGEGGQLPGFKVTELIAKLRHATPGVTLISPPPHHDIYSIEDLAQLIYDLKQINPDARVCVKLVSSAGIGTVAAGVAKAHADVILVSGHVGGTGASPQTSIKYAGTPWEMGLAEVNQVLTLNGLRDRVRLRTDGGLKTGRDIVIAAMLGAEEYGIGTLSLVAMGCIMVRQCHSNTCPVGVCTQDEALRAKFSGSPEKVINLMTFIAEETREILARLGLRTLDEAVGRTDLLTQRSRGHEHLDDLDLNPILARVDAPEAERRHGGQWRNPVPDSLDAEILADAGPLFAHGGRVQLAYTVKNTHRAVGARTSSAIVRRWGMTGLPPGHLHVRLRGSAGQSFGAFAVQGLTLELFGEANDYVGKGLSGATLIVRPMISSPLASNENTIIGNTALYGATSGTLFAAGQAGERFAVRNSGALTVVEGCGANGCEYMTGGAAVILGPVGDNFGAGMTGGMAFVLDLDGMLMTRLNPDSLIAGRLASRHWEGVLRAAIAAHAEATGSSWAANLLDEWEARRELFWQLCPKEMVARLAHPLVDTVAEAVPAE